MAIDGNCGRNETVSVKFTYFGGLSKLRNALSRKLYRWGVLNDERRKSLIRFNNLKSTLMQQQNVY